MEKMGARKTHTGRPHERLLKLMSFVDCVHYLLVFIVYSY